MKRINSLFALLLTACAGLFFFPLGARALWDSDEGRYAEIGREMLATGHWLVPHLNGVLYFEKPPFAYWVTALGLKLFGENAFGARFFAAFFGLLTIAVIDHAGRAWKNERTGLLAGGILATSLSFFVLTQYLVVDMVLTFWLALVLDASIHLLIETTREKLHTYALVLAASIAGAFLTKGLIGLLLPGAVLILTFATHRMKDRVREIPWLPAGLLFFALAAPWVFQVNAQYPFFVSFFFIHEHLARYFTQVHQRSGPIYYFVPVILIGFLPWIFFLPRVLLKWFRHRAMALRQDSVATLLVIWASFIFVFFSLSGSKLPAYMLPVFPALALLVGHFFDDHFEEEPTPRWVLWGIDGWIIFLMAILTVLKWIPSPEFLMQPPASFVVDNGTSLALVLSLCVMLLVGAWGLRQTAAAFGAILITQVLFLSSLTSLATTLDPWFSTQRLAQIITTRANPEDRVIVYGVSYETYTQTLAFYTHRRIAVYGPVGEFALGSAHAADAAAWFAEGPAATTALLQSPIGTWVITNEEYEAKLEAAGLMERFAKVEISGRLRLLQKISE